MLYEKKMYDILRITSVCFRLIVNQQKVIKLIENEIRLTSMVSSWLGKTWCSAALCYGCHKYIILRGRGGGGVLCLGFFLDQGEVPM